MLATAILATIIFLHFVPLPDACFSTISPAPIVVNKSVHHDDDSDVVEGNSENNITVITNSGAVSHSDSIANATADAQSRAKSKSRSNARVRNRVTDRAEADDDRRRGNGIRRAPLRHDDLEQAADIAAQAAEHAARAANALEAQNCRIQVTKSRDPRFSFIADPLEFPPEINSKIILTCTGSNLPSNRCGAAIFINHGTASKDNVGECFQELKCDGENRCIGICTTTFKCDEHGQLVLEHDQQVQQVTHVLCGAQCEGDDDGQRDTQFSSDTEPSTVDLVQWAQTKPRVNDSDESDKDSDESASSEESKEDNVKAALPHISPGESEAGQIESLKTLTELDGQDVQENGESPEWYIIQSDVQAPSRDEDRQVRDVQQQTDETDVNIFER